MLAAGDSAGLFVTHRWTRSTLIAAATFLFAQVAMADDEAVADDKPAAEEERVNPLEELPPEERQAVEERRRDEAALNEDPEAQRRTLAQIPDSEVAEEREEKTSLELYGSARVHAINTYDVDTGARDSRISDGNSRFGVRADWQFSPGWYLMGRGELGIDLVENFTTRDDLVGDGGLKTRLLFAGIESDELTLIVGQNWSAYYQVAGITDRFAIFGSSASGVYNAGTAGQATGTGRAEDVIQLRTFVHPESWAPFLQPFRLNLQYQQGQPIPSVDNAEYDFSYGASAFLEFQNEFGFGLAYNRAIVPENLVTAGASGLNDDAEALAISTRGFGERWYVSFLLTDLRNMEITDTGRYFDGRGFEMYAQWEVRKKWWLIGGYNSLEPTEEDPEVGEYRVRYGIIGGRYSIKSFERMVYFEYRFDNGRTVDGSKGKDEFTIGMRWDFSL